MVLLWGEVFFIIEGSVPYSSLEVVLHLFHSKIDDNSFFDQRSAYEWFLGDGLIEMWGIMLHDLGGDLPFRVFFSFHVLERDWLTSFTKAISFYKLSSSSL